MIARYLEAKFAGRMPMRAQCADQNARMEMFISSFMELVVPAYAGIMAAKSQQAVDHGFEGIMRGLHAVEKGLCGSCSAGPLYVDDQRSLAEALTAPLVVRLLANLGNHRGVDVMQVCEGIGLHRTMAWMKAVQKHHSIIATRPSEASMQAIPPYLEPFFSAVVSRDAHGCVLAGGTAARETEESKFASLIRQGKLAKAAKVGQAAKL
eukprot:TRINITY_DN68052_c0_g1_i1.p1 TRINITY_DN68052_c0_g1~~TRINITY_DN68052_c0_g1_i1.p1  ORF type:complete len:229 (+),score=17.97 TRINITY_DN68052_c0_g1_i1:64-687(+)